MVFFAWLIRPRSVLAVTLLFLLAAHAVQAEDTAGSAVGHLIDEGWQALEAGRLTLPENASAAAKFEQALRIDPSSSEARRGLTATAAALRDRGNHATEAGDPARAVSFFRQSIALEPQNGDTHALLGHAYLDLDQDQRAADAFKGALAIEPNNIDYLTGFGSAAYQMGHYPAAADAFRRVLAVRTDHHTLHRLLGHTYENIGQWADAAASHRRAFDLDPRPRRDYQAIGGNYLRAGRYADAIPFLEQAAEILPDDPALWDDLATAYHRVRRVPEATAAAKLRDRLRAGGAPSTTASVSPPAISRLSPGLAAFDRGDWATAVDQLPLEAVRGDAEAAYRLGRIYHQGLGVPADAHHALFWYTKAAEANHPGGQAGVGYMHYRGEGGVARDPGHAAEWFHKAADGGVDGAMARLGNMYEHGDGVPEDSAAAVDWYYRAAMAGNMDARTRLAELGLSASDPAFTKVPNASVGFGELPDLKWQTTASLGPIREIQDDATSVQPPPPPRPPAPGGGDCGGILGALNCMGN